MKTLSGYWPKKYRAVRNEDITNGPKPRTCEQEGGPPAGKGDHCRREEFSAPHVGGRPRGDLSRDGPLLSRTMGGREGAFRLPHELLRICSHDGLWCKGCRRENIRPLGKGPCHRSSGFPRGHHFPGTRARPRPCRSPCSRCHPGQPPPRRQLFPPRLVGGGRGTTTGKGGAGGLPARHGHPPLHRVLPVLQHRSMHLRG